MVRCSVYEPPTVVLRKRWKLYPSYMRVITGLKEGLGALLIIEIGISLI